MRQGCLADRKKTRFLLDLVSVVCNLDAGQKKHADYQTDYMLHIIAHTFPPPKKEEAIPPKNTQTLSRMVQSFPTLAASLSTFPSVTLIYTSA